MRCSNCGHFRLKIWTKIHRNIHEKFTKYVLLLESYCPNGMDAVELTRKNYIKKSNNNIKIYLTAIVSISIIYMSMKSELISHG